MARILFIEDDSTGRVLALKGWNVSQAARSLGVPRHILTYRMDKYDLRRPG